MPLPQRVGKGVPPRCQPVGGIGHQLRQQHHRRRDGRRPQAPRQRKPAQPRTAHKHKHRPDRKDEQRAGEVRLKQHQHRDNAQNQRKRQHTGGKRPHSIMIQRYNMGKHQHHRKFCDLAGLQRAQPGQHDPPFAAIVLRHKENDRQQRQRQGQHRPGQPVPDMVVHQTGCVHGCHPQRRKQQLRADVGVSIAAAVERDCIPG